MTSLAEVSEARKQRLEMLRRRKLGQGDPDTPGERFQFRLRNFDPETRTLAKRSKADEEDDTVEKNVSGLAEQIIAEDEERRKQELDLFNIAPKRPNWDLKRNMEKKTAKLERKTQEAIHVLIRKRMSAQQGTPDDLSAQIKAQERDNDRADTPSDAGSDDEE